MTDTEFFLAIKNLSLPAEQFNHKGHIRLAKILLKESEVEQASRECCHLIKTYASSMGAKDKFHHTITVFLVYWIAQNIELGTEQQIEELDTKQVVLEYYPDNIFSDVRAKESWIAPTKKELTLLLS